MKARNKLHKFIKKSVPGRIDIVVQRFEIGPRSSYTWMYTNTVGE